MIITLTPVDINAQIQGSFPISVAINKVVTISPVIGGIGIKGDKGDKGDSANSELYTAGQAISGHTAVFISHDGSIYPASPEYHLPILGITKGAVEIGASVEVQNSGVISMIGWNFSLNSPVFVLSNGSLSTTQDPLAKYCSIVGISTSPTSLVVGIQPQIKLS